MNKKIDRRGVLRVMSTRNWRTTLFIINELMQLYKNKPGHWPGSAPVRRALRRLEREGLVKEVGGPTGYYGYEWEITEAGKKALAEECAA